MKAVCIDDEPLAVEYTLGQCASLSEISEAKGFTDAFAALDWIKDHPVDLVILDINMPHMDGITLAARIKQLCPQAAILFLTAYKEFAFDAYVVHPAGYLLKPVSLERLAAEVRYVCGEKSVAATDHIRIKTFGYFDVYVDGRPVSFKLAKAKEILAYLVDKQGSGLQGRNCLPPFGKTVGMTARCRSNWMSISVPSGNPCRNMGQEISWR
ncbi:MAG: response regulator [Parasporobacterium sp.]|nr:response regulator [Parasporobacterium sp.]